MLSLVDLLQTNHPSSSGHCTIEIDLIFVTVVPDGVEVACCYLKSDFFFFLNSLKTNAAFLL